MGANAVGAVELPHPSIPIFEVCSSQMSETGDDVPGRILALGWTETMLTEDIQTLLENWSYMNAFWLNIEDGQTSAQEWTDNVAQRQAEIDEANSFVLKDATYVDTRRVFRDPNGAGYVIFDADEDFWSCEIMLTEASSAADAFMTNPTDDALTTYGDGLAYLSVDKRPDFFPLLSKTYYAEYVLADPARMEALYEFQTPVTLAAIVSVIYPY